MVTTQEMIEMALGTETQEEDQGGEQGISGLSTTQVEALGDMDFTGKTTASNRFQNAINVISQIRPVKTQEEYQQIAEGMYPEQDYAKEKFWNDISLGLSLISGRSEGGRWGPVVNESLQNWLEAGEPIQEAERVRGAQVGSAAAEMRKDDVEAFRAMMGSAFITDMSAQLNYLDQYKVLSKEEATLQGLPTDRGQVWRVNLVNGKQEKLQGVIPREDKFKILSTKEATEAGFATEQGQVYIMNETTGKPELFQGAQVGLNFEILSDEEAAAEGLAIDDGQKWQRDKVTKETSQLWGITSRPQNFTVLSTEAATTFGLPTDNGQVYQRNNTTGGITEIQGYIVPTDNWAVMSKQEAAEQPTPLPTKNGEIWMINRKTGETKALLSAANISEREKRINDLVDVLKNNDWELETGKEPTDTEIYNHAVKMEDGHIDIIQQEDGRIYEVDKTTNTVKYINSKDRGKYPLIGEIDPANPYAIVNRPPEFTITDYTTSTYEESQRQIQNLTYAIIQGNDLEKELMKVVGPKNWILNLSTNTISAVLPGFMDDWAKFIGTARGARMVELYGRVLVQALSLNPRYPVAEQELINKLNAQGIKLFQDPKVGIELFLETQRFLKNRLAFNRAGLQIEPTEFLTVGVVPTGTSNDPIIIDKNDKNNTQGELYLNYLIQNDKNLKGVYVMFEEDGSVEKLDWEKIRKNQ